jgi:hypothetical protein
MPFSFCRISENRCSSTATVWKKQKDAFSLTFFLFKMGHDRKRLKEKC